MKPDSDESSTMPPNRHFADRMIARSEEIHSLLVVGLDPDLQKFPKYLQRKVLETRDEAAITAALIEFNRVLIDSTAEFAVAFKPQSAFYEQYGIAGMLALQATFAYLRERDIPIIFDGKRNDVGHTASAYGHAWLSDHTPFVGIANPWRADAVTANGYLGSDGIQPLLNASKTAGVFILAKTSNPSSAEFQDLSLGSETGSVFEKMGALAALWGEQEVGASGYSRVGLVVGATYPHAARLLRKTAPRALFLMPGVGAQGGGLDAIASASDERGSGAFAASSRSVMYSFDPALTADLSTWKKEVAHASAHEAGQLQMQLRQAMDNR